MAEREYVYSPERIRSIIRNWDAHEARSLNPASAHGLLVRGPTPEDPRLHKQRGHHGDPFSGIPVVADVRRAFNVVYGQELASLEAITVLRVSEGWSLGQVARVQQLERGRTEEAFGVACERMASVLGWVEVEQAPVIERRCMQCGGPITGMRTDAEYCGGRCRLKAWRVRMFGATATG